jgi:hypothetical protein
MATQPGTGLAVFDPKVNAPAHVAQFFDAEGTNIVPRTTVPSLSPEGKTWTIALDGQKHKMQRRNQDGDLEPLPIMKVVILDYAKQRGRAYYEGEYDPANVSAPVCWSDDGEAPDNSLPGPYTAQQMTDLKIVQGTSRKISEKCASCPMAVKGSKVIPGTNKAVTACAQHRMLAVLPDPTMGLPAALQVPLRMKIAMTSDWDKQSPDQQQQGWLAFSNFVDWINARGVKHTAAMITKMKFDPEAAYPKIFFSAERYLEANELGVVTPLIHNDDVKKLLGGTWTPAGVDGIPKDQQAVATPQVAGQPETTDQPPAVAAAAPPPAAAPAAPEAGLPAGYAMNPAEAHTYQAYIEGGWTDEQLIANGKLIAATPPPAEPEVVAEVTAPPPPVAQPVAETVVVGEPAPAAAAAPTTETAPPPAATAPSQEAVVVVETAAEPSPGLAAPAAVVVQEPAQASAPAPVATPQTPEPPAAAAAAAEAVPAVSTEVPGDVAALLDEWK